jgi:hypothetical protein
MKAARPVGVRVIACRPAQIRANGLACSAWEIMGGFPDRAAPRPQFAELFEQRARLFDGVFAGAPPRVLLLS